MTHKDIQLEWKLKQLFDIVVDLYIQKWEPIGSKFLHWMNVLDMAPSTLRKYLNILEKEEYLMQPYNSAGRVPTIKWFSTYIEDLIYGKDMDLQIDLETSRIRDWFRSFIEQLGYLVDWVVVWFLDNDEYYFLGINNLLKNDYIQDYTTVKMIVDYIESRKIVPYLEQKKLKSDQKIGYSFIRDEDGLISVVYTKIIYNWYEATIWILAPSRTNYKKNVWILKKIVWEEL